MAKPRQTSVFLFLFLLPRMAGWGRAVMDLFEIHLLLPQARPFFLDKGIIQFLKQRRGLGKEHTRLQV